MRVRDVILGVLVYVGLLLAVISPFLLVDAIINQITYGDWTCAFKECIVVKGDKK